VTVRVDPPLLRAVGETAARVSVALDGLDPPAPTCHAWELIRAGDTLRGVVGQVPDRRVAAALDVFERDLRPLFDRLPWTIVHHDLHDSNLLVGAGRITGILDFGDLTYGPRLAELAVAAAYAARNTADPHAAVLEVAAGWASVLPLTAEETQGLLPAVVTRLATNVAVWASRATGPRAQYATARAAGSVDALEALLQRRRATRR
jgi:hydroxylysine kinase